MQSKGKRERVERGIVRRLTADGRTVYEIEYRDSTGVQRRSTVAGGIKAARAQLADVKARMGRGERVKPNPRLVFGEAADRYMQSVEATLRPRTVASYRGALHNHLLPRFGKRRLDSLTVDDAARLVEEMQKAGRKAWTIRGTLVVFGRVIDHARRRLGFAGENPVRQLDRSERPRSDQRERRVLSGDELTGLLMAADERHRLVFALAARTGARLGETLGVRWRDFDSAAGTITFARQLDRQGQLVDLKTARSRRTVELPSVLVQELREQRLRDGATREALIFRTARDRPFDHRNTTRALAGAAARAGIEPAPDFHGLRHSHASAWIAQGGDLVELSARLGHRDPAITASVYAHEFEKARRSDERRARLDAIYGGTVAATERSPTQPKGSVQAGQVADLQAKRNAAQ